MFRWVQQRGRKRMIDQYVPLQEYRDWGTFSWGTRVSCKEHGYHRLLEVKRHKQIWCNGTGSRVAQRSKALHLSARGVTTDILVRFQAVSQPAVIGSPIRRHTIGPASSGLGFGRGRPLF
jgi:hypothetical protein